MSDKTDGTGMDEIVTVMLEDDKKDDTGEQETSKIQPRLFVCFEHEIIEFELTGEQLMGRPSKGQIPDIPVTNKYVSRRHGVFETKGDRVRYTSLSSTNGTVYKQKPMGTGETVELSDGDELIIPISSKEGSADIMIVCALYENKINIWRGLRQASRDTLTGLPGRNTFRTWYLMNHSWNDEEDISLFILDIDKFKGINDTYGHAAGDEALKVLSQQLRITAGDAGYICRWGGDEFTGILKGNAQEAKKSLDEMRQRISGIKIDDKFIMTISAGIADVRSADGDPDIDDLVKLADKALYASKESGRDRVCIV